MKLATILILAAFLCAACEREETTITETVSPTTTTTTTDTGPNPAATEPTGTSIAGTPGTVPVNLVDYRIEMPASLPAGETTFNVTNSGEERHNFEIEGQGIEEELESVLEPGQSGSLTVRLEPGTYKIYCPVADHEEKHGMTMQLTVQ